MPASASRARYGQRLICLLLVLNLTSLSAAPPPVTPLRGGADAVRGVRADPTSVFIVTKLNDTADGACDADCSLREAILAANSAPGHDSVLVPSGLYSLTVSGANENLGATGDLDITDDLTLIGDGETVTIIDANLNDRIFHIQAGVAATLTGVRVQNGRTFESGQPDDSHIGGGIFSAGTLTLTDSMVFNNASLVGGGLGSQEGVLVTLANSQFISNTAVAGAGVYVGDGELRVTDSLIADNKYGNEGGGLASLAATTILRTTIANNLTTSPNFSFGGGLYLTGDAPMLIGDSQVYSNTAWSGGGLFTVGSQIELSATTVTTNAATGFGGGIFNAARLPTGTAGDSLTLHTVTIAANTTFTAGAGIFNQGHLMVVDSTLSDNAAGVAGGGLHNGNYAPYTFGLTATVAISDSLVSGNSAGLGGGVYSANGIMDVRQSDLLSNTAVTGGGLLNLHRLTIDASTIGYNQASADAGGLTSSGQLTLTNSLIIGNQAATLAGGVLSQPNTGTGLLASSLVQSTTVVGNAATTGGGLVLQAVWVAQSVVATNTAQSGGGLYGLGPLTLTQSSFLTNTATGDGGGLLLSGTGVSLSATTIAGNSAGQDGGGLYTSAVLTLTNATVSGNAAVASGGGLYYSALAGGTVWLNNVTLAANQAGTGDGGGLFAGGAALTLTNSLLAANLDLGGQAPDCAGAPTTLGYNLVENMLGCTLSGTALGDLTNLPALLGLLAANGGPTWTHGLLPDSPALEAGNPATPGSGASACAAVDQREVVRPQATVCDIGAYEMARPSVLFSAAAYTASEAAGSVVITVTLSATSDLTATVSVATAPGTATSADYTPLSTTITFAPGDLTHTFTLTLTDDLLYEGSETLTLTLSNPVALNLDTPSTATLTLLDNEAQPSLAFSAAAYSLSESALSVPVTVTLSAPAGLTVTVAYATTGGTATTADYTPVSGTLTFAPGAVSATFSIPLLPDNWDENNETISVQLSAPTVALLGSPSSASLTLLDDDPTPVVSFNAAAYSASEAAGTAVMTVTLNAASSFTVTINYATSHGTATAADYTPASGTLTFAPGVVSRTFTVNLTNDLRDEANETVNLALSSPSNAGLGIPASATLTILDDDLTPTVRFSTNAYTATETSMVAIYTVTLSAASNLTVTVGYSLTPGTATPGADYQTAAGTLIFAPGVQQLARQVILFNDTLYEAPETVHLTLFAPTNAGLGNPATAILILLSDDPHLRYLYLPLIVR